MSPVKIGMLSLDVPADWTLSTVILVGPPADPPLQASPADKPAPASFQRNVIITMESIDDAVELDDYLRKQDDGLLSANVENVVIGEPEDVALEAGKIPAILLERIIAGPSGDHVRQMQLISIKEGVATTIIASHLDGPAFEEARLEFRNLLLSVLLP